jgi:hypothetical protein
VSPALRLHRDDAPRPASDPARGWLDAFAAALPDAERAHAVDELASHLREREADLRREGAPPALAASLALAELGEPVSLARQIARAASRPTRRTRMHAALIAASSLALAAAVVVVRESPAPVRGTAPTAPAALAPAALPWTPPPGEAGDALARVRLTAPAEATWEQLVALLAEQAGMPVTARYFWLGALPGGGISAGTNLGHELNNTSLASLLRLVNEELNLGPDDGVACRIEDGTIVLSTLAHFDRLDTTLVSYDLAPLVDDAHRRLGTPRADLEAQIVEQAAELITSLVSPELWIINGGERASIRSFGTKVFVSAPRRLLPRVEWVLGELSRDIAPAPAADAKPDRRTGHADPVAPAPNSLRVRADAGQLVLVRPDGTEVRCDQLALDLSAGGLADQIRVVERSDHVLRDVPIVTNLFTRAQPRHDVAQPRTPADVPAPDDPAPAGVN